MPRQTGGDSAQGPGRGRGQRERGVSAPAPKASRRSRPKSPAAAPKSPGAAGSPAPGAPAAAEGQRQERALDEALAALSLALDPPARRRLLAYVGQLAKWNAVYNLTAIRDPAQMLVQHLFDCLSIVGPLRERGLLRDGAVVLDVGSGGGLPGVVLAIVEPGAQVHCVDAVGKKAAFVGQLRGELDLPNLHAHHARVEELAAPADLPTANLIVSRAFSTLEDFVNASAHLQADDGVWAAMKGRLPEDEISALPPGVALVAAITLRVPHLDAQRHLLILQARG